MRDITKIYIHHSALSKDAGVSVIRKFHIERGFDDIGYHFVIERDGKVCNGRKLEIQGAHVKKDNIDSIGICVCGNFEISKPNKLQIRALKLLICKLCKKFGELKILGHRDFILADTLCPGRYLYDLLPDLRKSTCLIGSKVKKTSSLKKQKNKK